MARKKQEEPEAIKNYRENIRNKSVRQLVTEAHNAVEEDKQEEIKEAVDETQQQDKKEEPEKADVKIQTLEDREKELEEFKKTATEAAKSAAEESTKSLKEEIQKIKESDLSAKEKKEEIAQAKAKWTGFDKTSGVPTPKDYDEIVSEAVRLAKEESAKLYKEEIQKLRDEIKKESEEEVKAREAEETANQQRLQEVNNRIQGELESLYSSNKLAKPKDFNDKNDPAVQELDELFKQASEYNAKQVEEKKPIEDSIIKFYFLHYQPKTQQPAGADAPVTGAKTEAPEDTGRFNYVRDIRKPSFRQILRKGIKQG